VVTVADCERVQASWYRARAEVLGGEVWTDGPLTWVDGPDVLRAVCTAAHAAGAEHAVLNATPEGKLLCAKCGFAQIGEGITWWLHLA